MTTTLGRYQLLEKIGEGGFAIVYKGRDTQLDRLVALKELRPTLLNDSDWVTRFQREAQTIARLDHPHIVTVHDVYNLEQRLFIVMGLVDGQSLEELIQRQGKVDWQAALNLMTDIAIGLDYAHAQGVLHRDLKPANILIDSKRGPMLTDFGLAKLTSEHSLSASGTVVGTPHYIAPEVWEGGKFTPQADIYALGCIFFELLTGKKAFQGETPPAIMMAHFKPPNLPNRWPTGIPNSVSTVLQQALNPTPEQRYPSAKAFTQALASLSVAETELPTPTSKPDFSSTEFEKRPSTELPTEATPIMPSPIVQPASSSTTPLPPITPEQLPDLVRSNQMLQQRVQELEKTITQQNRTLTPDEIILANRKQVEEEVDKAVNRKRSGCFWGGFATIISMMLFTVIIFGQICSTVEGVSGNLGSLVSSVIPNIQVGETVTDQIIVPAPPYDSDIELTIEFNTGLLDIESGDETNLIEAQVTYNAVELKPETLINGETVRFYNAISLGIASWLRTDVRNEWNLELGPMPLDLTLDVQGAEGTIELGGLAITDLTIRQHGSSFDYMFAEPNQTEMDKIALNGAVSDIKLLQLANARAKEVIVDGGGNNHRLDFTGLLQNDMAVTISSGIGEMIIVIPETFQAEVTVDEKSVEVIRSGSWQRMGKHGQYFIQGNPDYTIFINSQMVSGELHLRTVKQ